MRGWRRLGVVLSVFWLVGFGQWLRQSDIDEKWKMSGHSYCYARFDIRREGLSSIQQQRPDSVSGDRRAQLEKEDRDKLAQYETELSRCQEEAVQRFVDTVSSDWAVVLVDVFVLALLWLLGWTVIVVGRWVAAGFRQQA